MEVSEQGYGRRSGERTHGVLSGFSGSEPSYAAVWPVLGRHAQRWPTRIASSSE